MAEEPRDNREERSQEQASTGSPDATESAAGATRTALNEAGETLRAELPSLATVAAAGVGVALVEAELLPGLLIGAGAVVLGKVFPSFGRWTGSMLRPALKQGVRLWFAAGRAVNQVTGEVREEFEAIAAEVRAEQQSPAPAEGSPAPRRPRGRPQPRPATSL